MKTGVLVKRFRAMLFIIPAFLLLLAGVVKAQESPDLKLELKPLRQIYSNREGLVFRFIFTANQKTKLCLAKDILSQMQVSISRSGTGKLPLKPLVLQDNSQLFAQPMRVEWLEAGEKVTLRANLKRFQFAGSEDWTPGEYTATATFNLCEQTPTEAVTDPGEEIPVHTSQQAWFMIMI